MSALGGGQAAQGVAGAPGVPEVPLQEQDRVLIGALRRRKLFLGAGQEGFAPVQGRELVGFVGGGVGVLRVLPAEGTSRAGKLPGEKGGESRDASPDGAPRPPPVNKQTNKQIERKKERRKRKKKKKASERLVFS